MSEILDLIDGALRDYGASKDAMRWTPEPEQPRVATIETEGGGGYAFTLPPGCVITNTSDLPWVAGDMMSFVIDLETGYCRPLRAGEPVGSWLRIETEDGSIAEWRP